MKKIRKILLSILLVFCMFMTTNVNAEEVGGQALKELDSSVLDVIDSTYHIDKKESEVYSDFEAHYRLEESIKQEYIQKIKEAGYDTSKLDNLMWISIRPESNENGENDIPRHLDIDLTLDSGSNNNINKKVNLTYSNTSSYNQEDANYVKNQIKNLKTKRASGEDAIYTILDINNKEQQQNFITNYDYSKLLDDKSITIKVISGERGIGGNPCGQSVVLFFFKNDVAYAAKEIFHYGYFGTTSDSGAPIVMDKRDENTEVYKEMANELEKQGLTNIIGCYELTYLGSSNGNTTFSFDIGTQYNGRGVKILHRKSDGTYETFETTVENGKATITVNSFSPFMIALTDDVPTSTDTSTTTKLSNNAQTSSMNIVFYVILAIGSLIGITYILIKKKKIA